ncbi:MAG: NHL repeat-containing protein, partial [Chloroflexota bacterium]
TGPSYTSAGYFGPGYICTDENDPGCMYQPYGVEVVTNPTTGDLEAYIADHMNSRLRMWTLGPTGSTGPSGATGPVWTAQPSLSLPVQTSPSYVCTDPGMVCAPNYIALSTSLQELFVTGGAPGGQGHQVRVWKRTSLTNSWTYSEAIGNYGSSGAGFSDPRGVALVSTDLEMFVSDGNGRIAIWRRITTSDPWAYATSFGAYGQGDAEFREPYGIALSNNGLKLYIADSQNNAVKVWSRADTNTATTWSYLTKMGGGYSTDDNFFEVPVDVALSPDETKIYILDYPSNKVKIWSRTSTSNNSWSYLTNFGYSDLSYPYGLTYGPDALVYVGNSGYNKIQYYTS